MIAKRKPLHLVVDIGATEIRVGLPKSAAPTAVAPTVLLSGDLLLDQIREMIHAVAARNESGVLTAVSVGTPGIVRDGVVLRALHVPLTGVDLVAALERRLGVPIAVSNDVDAQAMGDGGATGGWKYFVVGVGTAVGGAYVVDGHVQGGRDRSIAEVGHLPVGSIEDICACGGAGCLDTAIGGWALEQKLGRAWWTKPALAADRAVRCAGAAASRAVRSVGVLYDLDYVLMLGTIFRHRAVWEGLFAAHAGLGADVPIVASHSTWSHAATGLARLARASGHFVDDPTLS